MRGRCPRDTCRLKRSEDAGAALAQRGAVLGAQPHGRTGRLMSPETIATMAVYWIGDESRPVSGSVLEVEQYPAIGRNPIKE